MVWTHTQVVKKEWWSSSVFGGRRCLWMHAMQKIRGERKRFRGISSSSKNPREVCTYVSAHIRSRERNDPCERRSNWINRPPFRTSLGRKLYVKLVNSFISSVAMVQFKAHSRINSPNRVLRNDVFALVVSVVVGNLRSGTMHRPREF